MQELVLDGATYVPLKAAAAQSGYEKNYLGQLCRAGKVDGRLVGRNWYINLDSLEEHTSREYGNRGTMAFVGKKEEVAPTIFPRSGGYSRPALDESFDTSVNRLSSSSKIETSMPAKVLTVNQPSATCEVDERLFSKTNSTVPVSEVIQAPIRVAVIPTQERVHTQPRVDLTNLLPPPPKSEPLVTPRIRPISRYFKDDSESDDQVLIPIQKNVTEPASSLQDEVSALRQERERRAHQYLVQESTSRQVTIDPIPGDSGHRKLATSPLSFEWFVPVSVTLLGILLLGGIGYVAFEQLAHREYAAGTVEGQQTASAGTFFELLFERKVEYK